ncbi:agamous-like MADS-box protein AGL80 [Hevea brasiliensis]|uniref:agamous-like MADS-box protein AGL80 n=1 Tax=Hevea brasiliensis TaxID=3981 RepID=UPI0025EB61FC|nr:agamous-like MADS-box protein AGL80 [Hevea brasiliensis]
MTRKKVKLAYITNDSARKETLKRRKKGLMKKVSELSTLCGIDACAIIYSPHDSQPEVWPSLVGVQSMLAQFENIPQMEQSKKMVNQDSFLRERICKANEHLKKQRKDNREKEMTQLMFQCLIGKSLNSLNMVDLNDLNWLIDQNLKEIHKRVETLNKEANSQVGVALASGAGPSGEVNDIATQQEADRQASEVNMEAMQKQEWHINWINPQEHIGFGGDEVILPFWDNNHNDLWSSAFFP